MNKLVTVLATTLVTGLLSCGNNNSGKDNATNVLKKMEVTAERNALRTVSAVTIKPDNTYVDLKTNKIIKIRMDTITRNIYDLENKYPIDYVIDVSTNDTFDRTGRIVNRALVMDKDGNWTVDENKFVKDKQE